MLLKFTRDEDWTRGKRLIVYLTVNVAAKRPEISPTQAWRNERRLTEPGARAAILGARASFVVWTDVRNTARPDVGPVCNSGSVKRIAGTEWVSLDPSKAATRRAITQTTLRL